MRRRGNQGIGRWALGMAAAATIVAAGCGKKGPPLPPLVHIPAAVDKITAERTGSDVYVTVTVPAQNVDKSKPADVRRIDVYAVTAEQPPVRGAFLAQASRIAEIPVAPVAGEDDDPSAPQTGPGAAQGVAVTVHDRLQPADLIPKPPPPSKNVRPPRQAATTTESAPAPPGTPVAHRFYMAIPFSRKLRSGPQGAVADVPLGITPDPPDDLHASYDAMTVTLTWTPSGGIVGYLLDRAMPIEAPPFEDVAAAPPEAQASDVPPGPTRYNVYRYEGTDPLSLPAASATPWQQPRPQPLNAAPLDVLSFTDQTDFMRTECYVVRAVRGAAGALVEGDPTPADCVSAVDTFPPAPPTNVTAVAAQGSIGLLWEPNAELDLGGYLVLRGEAGSATLQPLTDRPIAEPRYTDRTVVAGHRYVYAVVAVDDRAPVPNMSAESARVEETAR